MTPSDELSLPDLGERLIVVVGPSGAGKDAVVRGWLDSLPALERPHAVKRTITRLADDRSEAHEAVSVGEFHTLAKRGSFTFAWQAHDLWYGIRSGELSPLTRREWVVLNGSRQHLPQMLARAPACKVIEVIAAKEIRTIRLQGRGREDDAMLRARLNREVRPFSYEPALRVVNDGELFAAVKQIHLWWLGQTEMDSYPRTNLV